MKNVALVIKTKMFLLFLPTITCEYYQCEQISSNLKFHEKITIKCNNLDEGVNLIYLKYGTKGNSKSYHGIASNNELSFIVTDELPFNKLYISFEDEDHFIQDVHFDGKPTINYFELMADVYSGRWNYLKISTFFDTAYFGKGETKFEAAFLKSQDNINDNDFHEILLLSATDYTKHIFIPYTIDAGEYYLRLRFRYVDGNKNLVSNVVTKKN